MVGTDTSICTFSLKGGVGKTTLACALARRLQEEGHRVAFLDADYNNPVAHLLLGIPHQFHKPLPGYRIAPVHYNGLQFASVAFLFSARGASRQSAAERARVLTDLCSAIRWEPVDFLVVDTAPSSSEENRSLLGLLDPGVIVVAEGGILSERGLERTVRFLRTARARLIGILGNKSYAPQAMARRLGLPSLGVVPFSPHGQVQLELEPILKSEARRLGDPSLMQRGKRTVLRAGLEAFVKVREWQKE